MGFLIYFAVLRQGITGTRVFSSIYPDFSMVIKQSRKKAQKAQLKKF
jgi:hypothetical protein